MVKTFVMIERGPRSMQSKVKCNVIWKRPDGFHGAAPTDFKVVKLGNQLKLWLHQRDETNFPFRVSGGWQEEQSTARLNRLINLLGKDELQWSEALVKIFDDSMGDNAVKHIDDLVNWIGELKTYLKGDTWELEIMTQALNDVIEHLQQIRADLP